MEHSDARNGSEVRTEKMCARMTPVKGDYWVTQLHDGYHYLNPKDVFERKYRLLGPELEI